MEGAGGDVANASSTFVGASCRGKQVAEQEQEGRAVVLGESDSEDDVDGVAPICKRGRSSSSIWPYFTNDAEPEKHKLAMCKHCNVLVNHHKKSESAKVHLNRCSTFRKLMNGQDMDEWPDWFEKNMKGNFFGALESSNPGSSNCSLRFGQRSIKEYALPAVSKQERALFQKHMAMHYHSTGMSFQ
jgi:hypothetical protein